MDDEELVIEELNFDIAEAAASDAVGGAPCVLVFISLVVYSSQ